MIPTITRSARERQLREILSTEAGQATVRQLFKWAHGIGNDQEIPPGVTLDLMVLAILDAEYPVTNGN